MGLTAGSLDPRAPLTRGPHESEISMNNVSLLRNSLGCVIALLLAACSTGKGSSGSGGGTTGGGMCNTFTPQCSCNNIMPTGGGGAGTCDEYAGTGYCEPDGGSMGTSCMSQGPSCPTASRVGTCWPIQFDTIDTATLYYSPTFTTASAQTDCTSHSGCFISP